MRRRICAGALLLAGVAMAGCSAAPVTQVSGSCAGPILHSEPETAIPGDMVEVQGTGFLDGCDCLSEVTAAIGGTRGRPPIAVMTSNASGMAALRGEPDPPHRSPPAAGASARSIVG